MRALLDRMKSWVNRNADHFVVQFIPASNGAALKPHETYVRLWLTDMFLERDREWFENQYPMVHATVQLKYAGRDASFSSLARAPEGRLGPGERRNYPLTPLLPWSGGVVELEAGLSALPGKNILAPALDVLQQVSRLVTPPLASALQVATQVGAAVEGLLKANNEPVVLGLHDAFAAEDGGARTLRPGHFAIVARSPSKLKPEALAVVGGELHVQENGRVGALTGADYMLIEVSGLAERDDWRFPALEELIAKAVEAVVNGRQEDFERSRAAALTMALTSTDLTPVDRQRVAQAVRDELAAAEGAGQGAVGEEPPSLDEIVAARAPSYEEARLGPVMSLDELIAHV